LLDWMLGEAPAAKVGRSNRLGRASYRVPSACRVLLKRSTARLSEIAINGKAAAVLAPIIVIISDYVFCG
jgi:hypothetical protein